MTERVENNMKYYWGRMREETKQNNNEKKECKGGKIKICITQRGERGLILNSEE